MASQTVPIHRCDGEHDLCLLFYRNAIDERSTPADLRNTANTGTWNTASGS